MSIDYRMLAQASSEIKHLRRVNEILSAKVEVIDVFKAALLGPPRMGGRSPDIAWTLDCEVERLEKEHLSEKPSNIAPAS